MARTLWMAGSPITDVMCILERPLGGRQTLAGYAMSALGRRRGHPHHLQAPLQY
ncbi:hypothetical protein [Kitasatospora sp. CB01950]|uniref:hypothetical protein n=1 Tax=Kitasatospora sp. CB01950 TaxID=1703930 RepID=UPI0013018553|nr:hypothetical protein [Kitasatospora sp. CB01950]